MEMKFVGMFLTQKGTTFILNIFPETVHIIFKIVLKHKATFQSLEPFFQNPAVDLSQLPTYVTPKISAINHEIFTAIILSKP